MQSSDSSQISIRDKVKTDLENLFISSKVASCDNLIALYSPRYEASPDDLELVSNIVKMMGSIEGCADNDLYMKAATSLYKLSPSYTAAYYLYRLNSSKGNFAIAVKYLEEAIAFDESDAKTDAQYEYELAAYCLKNGATAKAYDSAKRVIDLDPALAGKANFLLGTIWGSTTCSGNEIEKRAHYWVAVDYLMKARNEDPSLASDANSLIGQYSNYFPQAAEAFMYDITNGQTYTVSCGGMRATTTVRTNK
jgi:tetratricopeptide (TPR) repeat protein